MTATSSPEPDVSFFPPVTYRGTHPATATRSIEVSYSSLHKDRGVKARIFARIPEDARPAPLRAG